MARLYVALSPLILVGSIGCAALGGTSLIASGAPRDSRPHQKKQNPRTAVIARAQVWEPTDVATVDIKTGPPGKGAFAFGQTVGCTYVKRAMAGNSPKFACRIDPDDEVKVKYGGDNGEVFGETAATRLLWALGFGSDHMYPVKVICKGCPATLNGVTRDGNESAFDPAVIERKMHGAPYGADDGWKWAELDEIDEAAGGASLAHRDALKLIAVFMQHTDSKPLQQRLICRDEEKREKHEEKRETGPPPCLHPFMLLNDVGLTFGRATAFNSNTKSGVNLARWSTTPIWKDPTRCVGNLPKSVTGTLDNPVISEQGRQFLSDLLMQLSDAQIHDLFDVSRVQLRLRDPGDVKSGFPTIDEWVDAFKAKRTEIASRHCS